MTAPIPPHDAAKCLSGSAKRVPGGYWGTQAFAESLLKLAGEVLPHAKARNYRLSWVRKAHDEHQAEAWVREGACRVDRS